jgi:hypothetical protein
MNLVISLTILRVGVHVLSVVGLVVSTVSVTLLRSSVPRLVRYEFMLLVMRLWLRLRLRPRLRICVVRFGLLKLVTASLRLLRSGELRLIKLEFGLRVIGPGMSLGLWSIV